MICLSTPSVLSSSTVRIALWMPAVLALALTLTVTGLFSGSFTSWSPTSEKVPSLVRHFSSCHTGLSGPVVRVTVTS